MLELARNWSEVSRLRETDETNLQSCMCHYVWSCFLFFCHSTMQPLKIYRWKAVTACSHVSKIKSTGQLPKSTTELFRKPMRTKLHEKVEIVQILNEIDSPDGTKYSATNLLA